MGVAGLSAISSAGPWTNRAATSYAAKQSCYVSPAARAGPFVISGGGAMQSRLNDRAQGNDNLHQQSTISVDGTGSFAPFWGQVGGFPGEITGFGDTYPAPAF